MSRCGISLALLWAVAACPVLALADGAATWSFSAGENATCPKSVQASGGKIVVDLSALPTGANVFRAVLRCQRTGRPGWRFENDQVVVVPADRPDEPLDLLPPRYTSLDATSAVARAVKAGAGSVAFQVKALRWWKRTGTRLDVWFTGEKAKNDIPKATGIRARHRNGQTLLTWTEADPPTMEEQLTFKQWRKLRKALGARPKQVRYRIYRSSEPITPASIGRAELVDEVGPLTCWNPDFHGISPGPDQQLLRYAVDDIHAGVAKVDLSAFEARPVPPGTGIYAHNPAEAGRAYYAVTCAVNGEEDLTTFDAANALAAPVDEKTGPGDPILQRVEGPKKFFYTDGITLYHYVRWEAPPRCNMPSRPYDYLVVVGPKLRSPAPLNLILHCWGSNLYGKGGAYSWFGWSRDRRLSGIGVASNQIPYDWWTCYHENLGTWRPWTEGVTRDFTPKRLLSFVDWMSGKWEVDKTRMCVSGESMGGSGSSYMCLRYPERFAYAYSSVGIHSPRTIKGGGFYESYARVCGRLESQIKHESGLLTFDRLDDALIALRDPKVELPFLGFGNGKNDHGIGWPHVVQLARALQEARRPHAVVWRMRGHGSGSFYPAGIDFRTDQSLPAFTRCSLDDDIGTAAVLDEPKPFKNREGQTLNDRYDGDPEGQINMHLRWKTDDLVDEPKRYEITVYLTSGRHGAPESECTVDITPRRLQKFQVKPGQRFTWTNLAVKENKQVQTGVAEADGHGLITLKQVVVTQESNRIRLMPAK